MRIVLCGAAREVTGSGYLVETATARVLVDFGMFQGSRAAERATDTSLRSIRSRSMPSSPRTPISITPGVSRSSRRAASAGRFTQRPRPSTLPGSSSPIRPGCNRRTPTGSPAGFYAPGRSLPGRSMGRRMSKPSPRSSRPCRTTSGERSPTASRSRLVDAGHILGSSSVEMTVREHGRERDGGLLRGRRAQGLADPP